jgi:gluconolactonase
MPPVSDWTPSPRYPDPSVVVVDDSFARYRLPLAKIERLATVASAPGPARV